MVVHFIYVLMLGSGNISFPEFLSVMAHQPRNAQNEAYLLAAFKVYDNERPISEIGSNMT